MPFPTSAVLAVAFVAAAADPLLPSLGNAGYDATSYDLSYDFRPSTPLMVGTSTMTATASDRLSRLELDFDGGSVAEVRVNGRRAEHRLDAGKLYVTPAEPLPRGTFRVLVRFTVDRNAKVPSPVDDTAGWSNSADGGFAWFGQPDRAHLFFPCNDDLADKALVSYRVTVPDGWTAIANGTLRGHRGSTFLYASDHPMAPQLAQLAVGKFDVVTGVGPHGLPLRSAVPTGTSKDAVARLPEHLTWLEERVGRRYPFDSLGLLGTAGSTPMQTFALETQALPVFPVHTLTDPAHANVVVHELAHQWFGDSVGAATWSDLWLSEGFATYFDHLWTEEHGGATVAAELEGVYGMDQQVRDSGVFPGRPGDPAIMFGLARFSGPLVVYALREEVGEEAFGRIVRTYLDRYRDGSATSADFTAVAVSVAGSGLKGFLDAWLYGPTTPPMPGHPEWKAGVR
ncbi:MAG TPA: M1 family metallopeptidase [Umezawaea sp.]|nr:M1 family metallopeptidase [Umezawaea sp.]